MVLIAKWQLRVYTVYIYSIRFVEMDDVRGRLATKPTRFLDQLRAEIRRRGMSYQTEKSYLYWAKYFIRFHNRKHPGEMGATEIDAFLSYLSEQRNVSQNTQRIALNAIVFLYKKFLQQDIGQLNFRYARRARRAPVVFSHAEAMGIIEQLPNPYRLMAELLYGAGLRLNECLSLRVKDLDFEQLQICVRDGKGNKDRFTLLPEPIIEGLHAQITEVATLHQYDLARGFGSVYMPDALNRKYPADAKSLAWQFLFPSKRVSADPRSGVRRRHHAHDSAFSKNLRKAFRRTGIRKKCSAHTFRHSFATRLLETGYDLKLIQSLLGHSDIRITEIYLHIVRNRASSIKSPLTLAHEVKEDMASYKYNHAA